MDIVFVIGILFFVVTGIIMYVSPKTLTREDKRDDPEALAMVKKGGIVFMGFAAGAALLALKYTLR